MLVHELVPESFEALALAPVGLVHDRRLDHPERELLAVDGRREPRLLLGELLLELLRELAEVALAGEAPELADPRAAVDRSPDRLRLLDGGQVGELAVDRLELEPFLVPREVQVVLLVEPCDEAVGPRTIVVEVACGCWSDGRHRVRRIVRCASSASPPTGGHNSWTSQDRSRRRSTETRRQRPPPS